MFQCGNKFRGRVIMLNKNNTFKNVSMTIAKWLPERFLCLKTDIEEKLGRQFCTDHGNLFYFWCLWK